MSLGFGPAILLMAALAGLVAGRVSADRGRVLGWIGGLSGVLVGLLATYLVWSWPSDIIGLALRWVGAFTVGYALMVAVVADAQKAEDNGGAVRVVARRRLDRVAAVVLAAVGVLVSSSIVVLILAKAGSLLEGGHVAGDLWWFVMAAGLPILIGGLLALPPAWLLWRGRGGGGTLALLWVGTAAVSAAALVATSGPGGLWFPFSLIAPSVAVAAPIVVGLLLAGWVVGRQP
jgi:hypothetical protein